jgi:dTDP-glucose pyrophosphorylase/CBS domain-containing protein
MRKSLKTPSNYSRDLTSLLVQVDSSIDEAISAIDSTPDRIALIIDEDRHMTGTVTDGDIRRGILANLDTSDSVANLERFRSEQYRRPIVAPSDTSADAQRRIMTENAVRHLPLVDASNRITGLAVISDFVSEPESEVSAVIFAGGKGTRLKPLTDDTPKPMLPIGGRPILEWVIDQIKSANIQDIAITTHYRPQKIMDHFGDGRNFGVNIDYHQELEPGGTAGGLKLLEKPQQPILVINADIFTDLNFLDMINFHVDHKSEMTVAVRKYRTQVDYGVVETDGINITGLVEKPSLDFLINAGIYVLQPTCFDHFPEGSRFDMTDLISNLVDSKRNVISFPIHESWLDIGQHADYEKAVNLNRHRGEND